MVNDTICQGVISSYRDSDGNAVIYGDIKAVRAEIADDMIEQWRQYIEGTREWDDVDQVVQDWPEQIVDETETHYITGNGYHIPKKYD